MNNDFSIELLSVSGGDVASDPHEETLVPGTEPNGEAAYPDEIMPDAPTGISPEESVPETSTELPDQESLPGNITYITNIVADEYTIMDKPLNEYTVSEGLLLLIFFLVLFDVIIKFVCKLLNWRPF